MMVHHMKLDNEPFNMIKDNRKTIDRKLIQEIILSFPGLIILISELQ